MRFYSLEKLINLYDGYRKLIKIDQYNLMLIQCDGQLYLLESRCPHRGHPLSDSDINGNRLRCSLHGYEFEMTSGKLLLATEEPCRHLLTYEVIYEATEVGVMLDP